MTEVPTTGVEDYEPVSKRTRRAGIVASVGDPSLTDRSKVAPLFLSKKEKEDKKYKKEQQKLAESTKTRLNDWKSVIGVEKDVTKMCPVFHKATLSSSSSTSVGRVSVVAPTVEVKPIAPLPPTAIVPAPYPLSGCGLVELTYRERTRFCWDPEYPVKMLRQCLDLGGLDLMDLSLATPCKPPPSSSSFLDYPEIDKSVQSACLAALKSMSQGKLPSESSSQITEWVPGNTREWCAGRLEWKKQHSLCKRLSKWREEDASIKRNRVAPILLVTGPVGCGKTSLVYAAAVELNMQVLEVSPADFSWQANGKRSMNEAVREALQSRQVKNEASNSTSQLVLIDDVDVLVKQDKSVINAISSMTNDSKRPLVLTCADEACLESLSLDEVFRIERVDLESASFLFSAYMQVLGKNTSWNRNHSDSVAKHCNGDLRRIAMAAEMTGYEEFIESQCFTVKQLSHSMPSEKDLNTYEKELSTLSFCEQSKLDPGIATILRKPLDSRDEINSVQEDYLKDLIRPFLSTRLAFRTLSHKKRWGIVLNHLGIMAQLSNASEFSTRRVRCLLDQFVGNSEQVEQLRNLFLFPSQRINELDR